MESPNTPNNTNTNGPAPDGGPNLNDKPSLTRELVTFSIPLILSGLLQQLYSWVDAFIVGNLVGEGALAAIGLTGAVTQLFIYTITGFAAGINILAARHYGAGNYRIQKHILYTFSVVTFSAILLLAASMTAAADPILQLLQTPKDIFADAAVYMRIVLCGMPFLALYNIYCAVLRGMGDSTLPLYSIVVSSAVNLVLDLLFVGAFHWEITGAAVATFIAQAAMTGYTILRALHKYPFLRFTYTGDMPDAGDRNRTVNDSASLNGSPDNDYSGNHDNDPGRNHDGNGIPDNDPHSGSSTYSGGTVIHPDFASPNAYDAAADPKFRRDILASGLRLALPITIQSAITAIGCLVLQGFMNTFGSMTVAAITTAYRVDMVLLLPIVNLTTGISTFTSQSIGAGDNERARQCLVAGSKLMAAISLVLTAVIFLAGKYLILLFGVSHATAELGGAFFVRISSFYIIFGLANAFRGYLEGRGDVLFSGLNGILSLIVRIVLSYALVGIFYNMVIAYAEGFSWCLMLALYMIRYQQIKDQPIAPPQSYD